MLKNTTTQFDFAAQPKVTALKPKYREPRETQRWQGTNLMNDPRIIRGNTYAAIVENKNQVQPPPLKKKTTKQPPKRQQRQINFDTGFEPQTPRAVDGRQHFSIQTEPFVQTLRDKPIQYEIQCQTDLFLDRPVEREFDPMKQKTGVDRTTQIVQNDPELFDFDYEVQPILEALISKTLETSRMQLYEENQLQEKQKQKTEYQKRRHARLAEAQKLEAKQLRLKQQTDRRNLQYKKVNEQETFAQKKIISRILSKQYLKNLKQNTNLILEEQGFFREPLQTDLYEVYSPWLYEQILGQLIAEEEYKNTVNQLTDEAQKNMEEAANLWIQKEKNRRQEIIKQRQEGIRKRQEKKAEKKRIRQEQEARKKAEQEAQVQSQQNGQNGQQSPAN